MRTKWGKEWWKWERGGKVEQQRRRVWRGNGKQGGRGQRKVARHPAAYPWTLWGGLFFHLFPLSFSPPHTHSARLAHEGAVAIKPTQHEPRLRERQRVERGLHAAWTLPLEDRDEEGEKEVREGGVQRGQRWRQHGSDSCYSNFFKPVIIVTTAEVLGLHLKLISDSYTHCTVKLPAL